MQTNPTKPALPAPAARYFERSSPAAVARCFTDDAIVLDERHEHRGRAAIVAWMTASQAKYDVTVEPLRSRREQDGVTVTAKVIGTFPGSPIELRYRFVLQGDLIARLEIAP